ncbi:MAG: hypothetical protein SynsKO_36410 [Synoicihabitans sp.]
MKDWRAEIDQESGLDLRGPQVSQQLGHMILGNSGASLQLNDQAIRDEKIGKIVPDDRSILISYLQRELRESFNSLLRQAVG